jgi:hypothetical protein
VRFDLLPSGQLHPQEEELHLAVGHLLVDLLIGPTPIFGDLKEHRNDQNKWTKRRKICEDCVSVMESIWYRFEHLRHRQFPIGPAPVLCDKKNGRAQNECTEIKTICKINVQAKDRERRRNVSAQNEYTEIMSICKKDVTKSSLVYLGACHDINMSQHLYSVTRRDWESPG